MLNRNALLKLFGWLFLKPLQCLFCLELVCQFQEVVKRCPYDKEVKLKYYKRIKSLNYYVLVAQKEVRVEVYSRIDGF